MKTFDITEKLNIKPVDFDSILAALPENPENIIARDLGKPEKNKLADGVFNVDVHDNIWMYMPFDKIQKLMDYGDKILRNYSESVAEGLLISANESRDTVEFMRVFRYDKNLSYTGMTKDYTIKKQFMTNIRTDMFKNQEELAKFWKKMNYFKILLEK